MKSLFLIIFIIFAGCSINRKSEYTIYSSAVTSEISFGIEEVRRSLQIKGLKGIYSDSRDADICFIADSLNREIKPEGFKIEKKPDGSVLILSSDPAGAMYGALELAEQISLYGPEGIRNTQQNPYMEMRGTKFNIPLDVRTPSYTDPCDAAQKNIAEMWSFDFWKEYIDNLARYRFNFISLWSLHPFPSMVKVPGYEDVALDDVKRSKTDWKEFYSREGKGFDDKEITGNAEVLKVMTIGEKIEFWKNVMAYGKSRNVDFYIVTWNIFVNGTEGKYGITNNIDNAVTVDYFRKSIKQMFLTYPDLAGIGLTTGENMPGADSRTKEEWAFNTYALGILDVAEEFPDRRFTLIHRQHMTGAKAIAERFAPVIEKNNIDFLFSFKYAQAHVMSSTRQPFSDSYVRDIEGMKTLWTLRNDDNYYFRWGSPSFVREFIKNIPHEVTKGFYYGSDQWVWGRDFLTKEQQSPRQLEIVRQWYQWMMWGRLGYNPDLSDEWFISKIGDRFPEADAEKLFSAWHSASMIYPLTTGFHWGALDFQWYIEGCKSAPDFAKNKTGFHDVERFISLGTHPGAGMQSIPEFVKMIVNGDSSDLMSPFEVAGKLRSSSDMALETLKKLKPGNNRELEITLNDIRTMALLGKYYAFKISGSANLALYRETKEKRYQAEAVNQLTEALEAWQNYSESGMKFYHNPLWTNRVGYVDWNKITEYVREDIRIAGEN